MYDMENLKKLKLLGEGAPEAWEAYRAFDKAALSDGVIPKKYKELIACRSSHDAMPLLP